MKIYFVIDYFGLYVNFLVNMLCVLNGLVTRFFFNVSMLSVLVKLKNILQSI